MTLEQIRNEKQFKLRTNESDFFVRNLIQSDIDFDVYLPTKGFNLQREYVWSDLQKQELIMSIILEKRIDAISFIIAYTKEKDSIEIIDGKQRLSTIIAFIKNEFAIELEGKKFYLKDLDKSFQLLFENLTVRARWIRKHEENEITDDDKIKWFNFINFAGTPQDAEHKAKLLS